MSSGNDHLLRNLKRATTQSRHLQQQGDLILSNVGCSVTHTTDCVPSNKTDTQHAAGSSLTYNNHLSVKLC